MGGVTTIEQLTLISKSPVSYNSEIRELAKCAADELEALQEEVEILKRTLFDKEETIEKQFNTIKSQSGRALTMELKRLRTQLESMRKTFEISSTDEERRLLTQNMEFREALQQAINRVAKENKPSP